MLDTIATLDQAVAAEALAGLTARPKTLPARLFYDPRGCELFERITTLPEYYVTRTEMALLAQMAPELAGMVATGSVLVEYGAGNAAKAEILLAALPAPAAYVPIDVAAPALEAVRARMAPRLPVHPCVADFLHPLALPPALNRHPVLGFFPGSTIGNLEPGETARFLHRARASLGAQALFLIGVDLRKDPALLLPAYDDAEGVTAAFNLNLLTRLNREAGAEFDLASFAHEARWSAGDGRIEMHLVSRQAQVVRVAGEGIRFAERESIHTENSYKHTLDGFAALARRGGWRRLALWTDPHALFSLHLLTPEE
jgi:dimethylhistidine N-methyltransferase